MSNPPQFLTALTLLFASTLAVPDSDFQRAARGEFHPPPVPAPVAQGAQAVGGALGQAAQAAGGALGQAAQAAGGALDQGAQAAGGALGQTTKAAGGVVNGVLDVGAVTLDDISKNTIGSTNGALGQLQREVATGGDNFVKTFNKAGSDTVTTVTKAGQDAFASYAKSLDDAARETKRGIDDSVEAAEAARKFAEREIKSKENMFKNAERRLRERKFVDAVWGLQTENIESSEDNFFKATQDSKVIGAAASSAAAAYGGPGGAAAYAAWSAYKTTGDPNVAFRAGLIAAATAQAGAYTEAMPTGTVGEVVRKAAVAGAAGGIAVAAAGGDAEAIKKGFLQSGGAVLIQSSRDTVKGYSPDAADALQAYDCLSARDTNCLAKTTYAKKGAKILEDRLGNPLTDTSAGRGAIEAWKSFDKATEQGKQLAEIANISKLPGKEAIPVLDNKFLLTWTYREGMAVNNKMPTVVLTQAAQPPPFEYKARYARTEAELTSPAVAAK